METEAPSQSNKRSKEETQDEEDIGPKPKKKKGNLKKFAVLIIIRIKI